MFIVYKKKIQISLTFNQFPYPDYKPPKKSAVTVPSIVQEIPISSSILTHI